MLVFLSSPCLQEDVCFQGYLRHMSSRSSPAPLTAAEQELQRIKVTEVECKQNKHMIHFTLNVYCLYPSYILKLFSCRTKLYG